MDFQSAQVMALYYYKKTVTAFVKVPGSAIVLRYIQSSYQNDPVRSVIELTLVVFFIRYLLAPTYSTQTHNRVVLTEEEIDELVDEWNPEPLVAPHTVLEERETRQLPVIVGPTGPKCQLVGGQTVTNLASYNFYNFVDNNIIKEKAIQTLRSYGVGPCGPPNFYGTQDVHLKLEADIASCLGTEKCIVYAQAFSTISSVIPAFLKRRDIIVADSEVNYAIRKGLQISRSTIIWFKHNDMEDLERVLKKVVSDGAQRPLTRRFIVTEGLFEAVGDVTNLPKLIELKFQYKFRLILDESWSFGVLGRTGRGITEAQNVEATQVDMIVGSLAGAICAGGGFCAGNAAIVDHQRIAAAAYTFSAALPAILATTATETLNMLQTHPEILVACRENVKVLRAQLDPKSDWVSATSSPVNPILLLVLKPDIVKSRNMSREEQERIIQDCITETRASGVLITSIKSVPVDLGSNDQKVQWQPQPALKICVTTGLTKKEVERAGVSIRHAITKVLKRKTTN